MLKPCLFFVCGVVLSGCATGYKQSGITGGYSETQLSENAFRVAFNGNGYANRERVFDFALLRAAEVAIQHGFRYFVVVDSANDSSLSTYTAPSQTYSTNGAYGQSTTYPGQTYLITKPSAVNTIVCFAEKPSNAAMVFDADFLQKSLKLKYGIP